MSYCTKCGHEINDEVKFCSFCGAKVNGYSEVAVCEVKNNKKHNTLSNIAYVFLIISAIGAGINLFMGLLILFMSFLPGLAEAGFVFIGIVYSLISIVILVFTIVVCNKYNKAIKEEGYVSTGLKVAIFFSSIISFILALCDEEHNN